MIYMSRSTRRSIRRSRRSKRGGASRSNRASNGNRRTKSIRGKSMRGGERLVESDFTGPFSYPYISYSDNENGNFICNISYTPNQNELKLDFKNKSGYDFDKTKSAYKIYTMVGSTKFDDGKGSLSAGVYSYINNVTDIEHLIITIAPNQTSDTNPAVVNMFVKDQTISYNIDVSKSFDEIKQWLIDNGNVNKGMITKMKNAANNFAKSADAHATSVAKTMLRVFKPTKPTPAPV